MCFLKTVRIIAITLFITSIASLTNATPIVFNFTGTVSDKYLDEHMQDAPLSIPEWKGKNISGSFTLDVNAVTPTILRDDFSQYITFDRTGITTQWMKFTVTNPDGSTLTFPTGEPKKDGEGSYSASVQLTGDPLDPLEVFQYFNIIKSNDYDEDRIELSLGSIGQDLNLIFSSTDLNIVEFYPEYTNEINKGIVKFKNEIGEKMEYYFLISSLTRIKSEVPESGSLILMLLGFFGLILNRRRMEK